MIHLAKAVGVLCILVVFSPAYGVFIGNTQGGTDFPAGEISFADAVIDYQPGLQGASPAEPYQGAFNAVGLPDYIGDNTAPTQEECTFVSLGVGGSLTLRFVDNRLTGSDSSDMDLWIFEIGPDIEDTTVEISKDGILWQSVGKVFGTTAGIDIDAYGFGSGDEFAFVRLTDVAAEGATGGQTVGADIDAVGAIATVVPEPATILLFAASGLAIARRRRK